MGLNLELKSHSENVNALAFSRQRVLVPVKVNMGDDAFGVETVPIKQIPSSGGDEDVEVDIIGCSNLGKPFLMEDSCEDSPECSSSFGDSGSGAENASSFSDTEVESRKCADDPSSSKCDDWFESCQGRKKRMTKSLTSHWRRFIHPMSWRCKWIELQMKQLQSQARKYEKELAAYNHSKQLDLAHFTLEDSNIKSIPISDRMHRNKVMKRNKRKRVEEQCDIESYMSNHSLFSYYEKTDCTADTCLKDVCDVGIGGVNDSNQEFKLNDEWSSEEYGNVDKSLDDIIQKIEAIQSEVQQLKTRTDKVISESCGKFCSITQFSMRGRSDGFNHFDSTFTSNENTLPFSFPRSSSQLESEFHMGDLLMPGNASASREVMIPCIVTTDGPELDDPLKDTKDEVLIHNQVAKEEWHDFIDYDGTKDSIEEGKFSFDVQVSEPDPHENGMHNEHSTWMSCSTFK
ncbi:hypothetical protein AAZX31_03G099000 [Glycine max]|uniref:uncharacterized protein isoform X1 n=2 Tax=Glycine max TaxID=3847 RepID=UPI0002969C8E|nr:uncharacterized protein LOC100796351 isoform X1 [Glycine max]XP_006576726.1 uncharacterized protein LOC100796351 isoform X1 [Glycine max]KAG4393551.1 hypothetical protein GLYMA_03G113800v4 [Glycine max]KAG4393555.1 hypothetical protein GLYMA_03G113800v4 [Glycine max]KAG5071981.1 hypothetical protein JHK86_007192 [Glycine max]KAH1069508.1 hypothetical protein GYH30_006922 [Glycine max]KAH1069511.1 hypothetical protein GYH30_006922 [Glycine max]|eukprot:XP_003521076.2 uncharacterized protein LOC100796351 isoform X1 [Glycine max]